ncbi:FIMAH domain-containing protein [Methanococcoides sp. FTZ1]|uniref:FIMAH domain-containing protein n=1 Tax=Methanococcoides sp. FTZ1 TaxID=3439061 RepID=UPI003F82A3F7
MGIKQGILISFGIALLLMTVGTAVAVEAPAEEWNMTFGGINPDIAKSVQQTSDGGFVLAGYTSSFGAGDTYDAWLIKTYENGTEEWNMTFGGMCSAYAYSVQQTNEDNGYIIAGSYEAPKYSYNGWLIKTFENGTIEWDKIFDSGNSDDSINSVQISDGGYILAGKAGFKTYDGWLIKTYANGTEEWNKRFDYGSCSIASAQLTPDGYILAGRYQQSFNTPSDALLIKTFENGTEEWNMTFGGTGYDEAYSVQQTSDGGFVLAGYEQQYYSAPYDAWLIKTDENGTEEWNMTFGGTGNDRAYSVQQTDDGGYIVAGYTTSLGAGDYDAWLIKTYENGTEEWNMTFGGTGNDHFYSVQLTSDGGYIVAGSNNDDAWLIKIAGPDPVKALESLVQDIGSDENLSASTIKSLNAKLDDVITTLDKEEYEKAIDKLEKFIDSVEKLKDQGKLSEEQAEDLIKEAETIIKLIENSEG